MLILGIGVLSCDATDKHLFVTSTVLVGGGKKAKF